MPKRDLDFTEDYAPVAERVRLFYERYPDGRIITELVSRTERDVVFKASVFRDAGEQTPAATGWAAEREGDGDINTVACLENTETSAVGRALANLGLTASRERPSSEEMQKATHGRSRLRRVREPAAVREWRGVDSRLQRRAHRATEALALLDRAERRGISEIRARVLRSHITRTDAELATLSGIIRKLGDWLDRHLDRALGAS